MLAQGRIQRVTTLIHSEVTRGALQTSKKSHNITVVPVIAYVNFGMPLANVFGKGLSRASHQPAAFCL